MKTVKFSVWYLLEWDSNYLEGIEIMLVLFVELILNMNLVFVFFEVYRIITYV
jgi:hypothetical protein